MASTEIIFGPRTDQERTFSRAQKSEEDRRKFYSLPRFGSDVEVGTNHSELYNFPTQLVGDLVRRLLRDLKHLQAIEQKLVSLFAPCTVQGPT